MGSLHHAAALAFTAGLALPACGGGSGASVAGSSGGSGGTYTSVADDGGVLELKSGGAYSFTVPGLGTSEGSYTIDGEKIVITMDGQPHTLIKTGECLDDARGVFSRMCIGGKAGEAVTQGVAAPGVEGATGTWKASTADGEFVLEFKPGNTLAVTLTAPGGPSETKQGTYTVERRVIHVRLGEGGEPMVLTLVNGAWESNSFGFPMKFIKQ
jgi:hypothetical protein